MWGDAEPPGGYFDGAAEASGCCEWPPFGDGWGPAVGFVASVRVGFGVAFGSGVLPGFGDAASPGC